MNELDAGSESSNRTDFAYKEWSAVIDVLGNGSQCVMIRSYRPKQKRFLLYPTFTYFSGPSSEKKFQEPFRELARKSASRTGKLARDELLVEMSYYAEIDEVIEIGKDAWKTLAPFFIWSVDHVLSYLKRVPGRSSAYLWLVRVYKLPHVVRVKRLPQGGPPSQYRHNQMIPLQGAKPVLSDNCYHELKTCILETIRKSR